MRDALARTQTLTLTLTLALTLALAPALTLTRPFTHDEGACYAPEALRRATLLVHWGRTQRHPNGSSEYHLWRVKPWATQMYGWQRCYDPCKDLVPGEIQGRSRGDAWEI